MKYFSLSTTTKLYLLTLLFLSVIIFLNQNVFAQDQTVKTPLTPERMTIMEKYQSWIANGTYGEFKKDLGIKTLNEFKSYLSRVISEDKTCLGSSDPAALSKCREKIKFDYKLAKKYNRVLKYLQIEEGKPDICVKADLGVNTALRVMIDEPLDDGSGDVAKNDATVYLCTDNQGNKILRYLDGNGKLLELSAEDLKKPEFQMSNVPPKDAFDVLLKKLGLTTPSGTITAALNPCTIPDGSQVCGPVVIEWDVTDETADPVEVKTADGQFIKKSRNGKSTIKNIGPEGQTFILYSLGRKINEVIVKPK